MPSSPASNPWNLSQGELREARLQLHWGLQILAAAADAVLEHREDDSHSNLGWLGERSAFVTHPSSSGGPLCAGLRLRDLVLEVSHWEGEVAATFSLRDRTLEEGRSWLASTLLQLGALPPGSDLVLRDYEMPDHPVARRAPFAVEDEAPYAAAVSWFEQGERLLQPLAALRPEATPVRCWPHHFDLATLLRLEPDVDPEEARSISVGMLLGDQTFDRPYWYVSPWPRPEEPPKPPLASGGLWHDEGFFAAVLTGEELAGASPEELDRRVKAFLESALSGLEEE